MHDGDRVFLGVNLRVAPDKLPPGILADSENNRMSDGEVAPRLGVIKPGWVNETHALAGAGIRPVGRFYGSGVFKDPDSFEWVIEAADGNIFRCKENNSRRSMALPPGVRILSDCTFCQAFNKLFCFRGRYLAPLVLPSADSDWQDIIPRYDATIPYKAAVTALQRLADEIAFGPYLTVTSLTSSSDIATVTTAQSHGYVSGSDVIIEGANQAAYNGRFNVRVIDSYSFTYQFVGSVTSLATGTIRVSNMSLYWAAVGSKVTLTALTWAAGTATATKTAHGFTGGEYVTIAGATPAGYNGIYLITVPTANTFTYVIPDPGVNTVLPTATSSVVLAGQSPETNPEAWRRSYNVLPNADNALFINNRMLVPTAYTPGTEGADGYNSTGNIYTKKDFIVATSIQDDVHFDFVDEFRINQGSDDEIVDLVKYDNDTVLVFKDKSWGILSNIRLDLTNVTLDMRGDRYGLCARGAVVVAGKDVYFMATSRGVVSLNQTQQGLLQSVDTPFSNDIEPWIRRINWNAKHLIRLAWWDNKLYVSVPMDDCAVNARQTLGPNLVHGSFSLAGLLNFSLTLGVTYLYTPGNETSLRYVNGAVIPPGYFVATNPLTIGNTTIAVLTRSGGGMPATAGVQEVSLAGITGTANAIFVHDFRNLERARSELGRDAQAWAGRDRGAAICPKEFILATMGGRGRLFFTAADGFVNLVEESTAGDEVVDFTRSNLLGWAPIATRIETRGFTHQEIMPKRFPYLELGLSLWNAKFAIMARSGLGRATQSIVSEKSFSRTHYLRPFDRQPWDAINRNDDFAEPHRGDYSLVLTAEGFYCGSGVRLSKYYDAWARYSTRTLTGGAVQFLITNTQGRCALKAISPAAQIGPRRMGILV